MRRAWPNLFLIGAPRCGTTSLFSYLALQPGVFAAREKEPHYYDRDVVGPGGPTAEQYSALFAGATSERWRLVATATTLYSASAPAAIRRDVPDARIVVALRDPVEFVASWHRLLVASGAETIVDLAEAIAAEPDRLAGRRLPPNAAPRLLQYSDLARFELHLERWLRAFPPGRIHVVQLEDIVAEPRQTAAALLDALGLEPASDSTPFPHLNATRAGRSRVVPNVAQATVLGPARTLAQTVVPRFARGSLWQRLGQSVMAAEPPPPLTADERIRIGWSLRVDTARLAELIEPVRLRPIGEPAEESSRPSAS